MTNPTNALSDNYPPFDSYPHIDECKCVDPYLDWKCLGLEEGMTVSVLRPGSQHVFTDTISKIVEDRATGTVTILTNPDDEGPDSSLDVTPLSVRMLEAADTLEAVSKRYGYGHRPGAAPWNASELRMESEHVAAEEADE